eukprot:jgi/Chlat1/4511/Chrsp29S08892
MDRRSELHNAAVSRPDGRRPDRSSKGCRTVHATMVEEQTPVATDRKDRLVRMLSANQEVSVVAITGTELVREAADRHRTAPTATAAFGRALMGSVLLASFQGPDETVTFKGSGPLGQLMVIAEQTGQVKGFVANPQVDLPLRADGKLNVGAAVGKGVLTVVRSHPTWKDAYTGMIPIYSGEVAEDIAHYLVDSEQVNSAVGLGVVIDKFCAVEAAGGYMVQVLPFASESTLQALETTLMSLPSPSDMVRDGMTADDIAHRILEGVGVGDIVVEMTPSYGPCEPVALQKRMLRAIATLGQKDIKDMLAEQGHVEVICEFCQDKVVFEEHDLAPLLQD